MVKINFQDNITKANAATFNTMQDNIEDAITDASSTLTTYVDNKVLDVYSTTETRIGTWIDGKPIYRKIYNNVNITTSNTDLINISSLGIGSIVKIYGVIFTSSNNAFPVPLTDSSSNYSVIFATSTALRGRAVIGSGTLSNCWLAIEYTKSAD